MNKDLKGLYAALLVPFDENGQEIKKQGLKQIAQNAIENVIRRSLCKNGAQAKTFY